MITPLSAVPLKKTRAAFYPPENETFVLEGWAQISRRRGHKKALPFLGERHRVLPKSWSPFSTLSCKAHLKRGKSFLLSNNFTRYVLLFWSNSVALSRCAGDNLFSAAIFTARAENCSWQTSFFLSSWRFQVLEEEGKKVSFLLFFRLSARESARNSLLGRNKERNARNLIIAIIYELMRTDKKSEKEIWRIP